MTQRNRETQIQRDRKRQRDIERQREKRKEPKQLLHPDLFFFNKISVARRVNYEVNVVLYNMTGKGDPASPGSKDTYRKARITPKSTTPHISHSPTKTL